MFPCASHTSRTQRRLVLSLVALSLVFLSGITATIRAATPSLDEGFIMRDWYVEDGLPHNVVSNIVRDSRGFLWVGTLGGLARFDGREFIRYDIPKEFMGGSYNIRSLAVEDDHTLLIITGHNKLVRLRDGVFELHPANALLDGPQMRDVTVDAKGAVWISTNLPSVVRWDGKCLKTFGADVGITSRSGSFSFASDREGRMWIAYSDFLGWYDERGMHRYEGDAGRGIIIAPSRSGGVWVATNEHLAKLENGVLSVVFSGDEWPSAFTIRDIFEAADNSVWVTTRRDPVFRFANGELRRVPMIHERVTAIADDIDGNVWMGIYGGGLVRAKPRNYVLLNMATGFPTDVSGSVSEDEDGALWCANQNGGLVRVKDGKISIATLPNGSTSYMGMVCADRQGRVWASSSSSLYWTTVKGQDAGGGQQRWILNRFSGSMPNVLTLFRASNGGMWIGWDYRRLGVLRDGVLREFTKENGYPGTRVAGIDEDRDGVTWICLEDGTLLRLEKDGNQFVEQKLPANMPPFNMLTLFVDTDNRLWLGTTRGLILWRGGRSRLFNSADGLPDDIINQIVEDKHQRLWISSRRGIFNVPIEQLLAIADKPGPSVSATLYGRDENLEGISGMSGGQPKACFSHDQRAWFVTYRGVIGFDTSESNKVRQPFPVYIDRVTVGGVPIRTPAAIGTLRVPAGAAPLEMHFAALNFSTPDTTSVRRMLEGFDPNWVDAGNEHSVTYPRLPPGRYVFRVQSGDAGSGIAGQTEASLVIVVAAAWWQTPWAWLGAILLFAAIIALIARAVSNRILKRRLRRLEHERALERERSRIARDLHDDLGGHITKIGLAADRLQRQHPGLKNEESLGRITTHARQFSEDLHRIIWTVNPQNDSWPRLATYIAHYAQRHLSDTGIICTVDGVDSIPPGPITPEVQHHLLALTNEALNNMLKHSKADRVTIQLSASDGRFHMTIADNGRGFDTTATNTDGNGLANMRARIAEIDGHIEITSHPGQGTQIAIDAPFQCKPPAATT